MTVAQILRDGEQVTLRATSSKRQDDSVRSYFNIEGSAAAFRTLAAVLTEAANQADHAHGGLHVVVDPSDVSNLKLDGADALQLDVLRT